MANNIENILDLARTVRAFQQIGKEMQPIAKILDEKQECAFRMAFEDILMDLYDKAHELIPDNDLPKPPVHGCLCGSHDNSNPKSGWDGLRA